VKVKPILPALTEATSPFWRPIKHSLFPPLGLATLAAYLPDDVEVEIQDPRETHGAHAADPRVRAQRVRASVLGALARPCEVRTHRPHRPLRIARPGNLTWVLELARHPPDSPPPIRCPRSGRHSRRARTGVLR
jgi:hypothetical protein